MSFFILQEIKYDIQPNNLKITFIENKELHTQKTLNPSLKVYLNSSKSNISTYNE